MKLDRTITIKWISKFLNFFPTISMIFPYWGTEKSSFRYQWKEFTAHLLYWLTDFFDILQLFERTPMDRLGYRHGTNPNLRGHTYFKTINWTKLEARQIEPPFKPNVVSVSGVRFFCVFVLCVWKLSWGKDWEQTGIWTCFNLLPSIHPPIHPVPSIVDYFSNELYLSYSVEKP
jgi:hypothetical protein